MGWLNIFKRVNKVAEAKANTAVDTIEDPVQMTEQAIRDLREKLQKALNAEVKLKALVIEKRSNSEKDKDAASAWEDKANKVLDRVGSGPGQIPQDKADELAGEALNKQKECTERSVRFALEADNQQKVLDGVDSKVKELRTLIQTTEEHLTEIRSRQLTAEVSRDVNKELTSIGIDNTKELIARMERKVSSTEFEAQAYGQLEDDNKTAADEIDEVLKTAAPSASDALAALKAKRNSTATAAK